MAQWPILDIQQKNAKTETARLAKEEDIGGPKLLEVLQWDRMGLGLYPP